MGQITEAFARQMLKHAERGEHSPLTIHEEKQLAYAWLKANNKCCRCVPCLHPGVGPCDMPATCSD